MKTCVFITGTNAVGKSTLTRAIIAHYGGVDRIVNDVTYCVEGGVCLAGKYREGSLFGGVDGFPTKRLADVVEEGLRHANTIFCEGSFMNSFGLNLTNAMFKGERNLVVNLFSDCKTITDRLIGRSGITDRNYDLIFKKQKQSMMSARKWQSIGVKVLQFNTAEVSIEEQVSATLKAIGKL